MLVPVEILKAKERGHANHGWLDTYHTFSFGDYYNPKRMGFGPLRVINDDVIAPDNGFGMHPHRDMEILSFVVDGELKHEDNMGNGSIIKSGCFQKMSAGTGVLHSEYNPSKQNPTRLLQIWIVPDKKGILPSYQELTKENFDVNKELTLVASDDKNDGVIHIQQKVRIYHGSLANGKELTFPIESHDGVWLQMVTGQMEVNAQIVEKGDGLSALGGGRLKFHAKAPTVFLLFSLIALQSK